MIYVCCWWFEYLYRPWIMIVDFHSKNRHFNQTLNESIIRSILLNVLEHHCNIEFLHLMTLSHCSQKTKESNSLALVRILMHHSHCRNFSLCLTHQQINFHFECVISLHFFSTLVPHILTFWCLEPTLLFVYVLCVYVLYSFRIEWWTKWAEDMINRDDYHYTNTT